MTKNKLDTGITQHTKKELKAMEAYEKQKRVELKEVIALVKTLKPQQKTGRKLINLLKKQKKQHALSVFEAYTKEEWEWFFEEYSESEE